MLEPGLLGLRLLDKLKLIYLSTPDELSDGNFSRGCSLAMRFNSCVPFHISFSAVAILFPCWSSLSMATMRTGQQPTNIPNIRRPHTKTRKSPKNLGKSVQLRQRRPTRKELPETKEKTSTQTRKPKTSKHTHAHVPTLESNHGILPNKRRPLRNAIPRPQKNREHTALHSARQLRLPRPRRPEHLQSS